MTDSSEKPRLRVSFDDLPDDESSAAASAQDEDIAVSLRPRSTAGPAASAVAPGLPVPEAAPDDAAPHASRQVASAALPAAPDARRVPPTNVVGMADGDVEYASWISRVGAALIDWLVLFAGTLVLMMVFTLLLSSGLGAGGVLGGLVIAWLLILIVQMAYAPTLMAREMPYNGQTLGKQLLGLRVCRTDGRPMWFWFGVLRNVVVAGLLFGFVGSLFFGIPLILDLLWPLWDSKRRCLHDIVVSTVVTREV